MSEDDIHRIETMLDDLAPVPASDLLAENEQLRAANLLLQQQLADDYTQLAWYKAEVARLLEARR